MRYRRSRPKNASLKGTGVTASQNAVTVRVRVRVRAHYLEIRRKGLLKLRLLLSVSLLHLVRGLLSSLCKRTTKMRIWAKERNVFTSGHVTFVSLQRLAGTFPAA